MNKKGDSKAGNLNEEVTAHQFKFVGMCKTTWVNGDSIIFGWPTNFNTKVFNSRFNITETDPLIVKDVPQAKFKQLYCSGIDQGNTDTNDGWPYYEWKKREPPYTMEIQDGLGMQHQLYVGSKGGSSITMVLPVEKDSSDYAKQKQSSNEKCDRESTTDDYNHRAVSDISCSGESNFVQLTFRFLKGISYGQWQGTHEGEIIKGEKYYLTSSWQRRHTTERESLKENVEGIEISYRCYKAIDPVTGKNALTYSTKSYFGFWKALIESGQAEREIQSSLVGGNMVDRANCIDDNCVSSKDGLTVLGDLQQKSEPLLEPTLGATNIQQAQAVIGIFKVASDAAGLKLSLGLGLGLGIPAQLLGFFICYKCKS